MICHLSASCRSFFHIPMMLCNTVFLVLAHYVLVSCERLWNYCHFRRECCYEHSLFFFLSVFTFVLLVFSIFKHLGYHEMPIILTKKIHFRWLENTLQTHWSNGWSGMWTVLLTCHSLAHNLCSWYVRIKYVNQSDKCCIIIMIFWDMMYCSLLNRYQCFREIWYFHLHIRMH